jgi:hypothetical protein
MFSLQQNRRRRGQNLFCKGVGGGRVGWEMGGEKAQTMYTHMNK